MTTILHVEDDESLAEMVEDSFRPFGFRDRYLATRTLEEEKVVVDDVVNEPILDLVLSDMHLPDGTGLDVVSSVRSNAVREDVPVVILSGDTSPEIVKRAYAVGANSYVPKGMRGRKISETMCALYAHWLKDARLPSAQEPVGRTYQAIGRGIHIRRRKTELYLRIAEQLGNSEGAFWVDFALREGNLANLLAFLRGQLGDHELSSDLLDLISQLQGDELRALDRTEHQPVRDRADAERYICELVTNLHADLVARLTAELFPAVPVAMAALCDVAADSLDEVATWIETHGSETVLRDKSPRLRADAALLRSSEAIHRVD